MKEFFENIKLSVFIYGIGTFVCVLLLLGGYYLNGPEFTAIDTYSLIFIIFGLPVFIAGDVLTLAILRAYRYFKG